MRIELQTADGEPLHAFTAPHRVAPDMVYWNNRPFVYRELPGPGPCVYREAKVYIVPEPMARLEAASEPLKKESH